MAEMRWSVLYRKSDKDDLIVSSALKTYKSVSSVYHQGLPLPSRHGGGPQ